jgi:hypothetical protein
LNCRSPPGHAAGAQKRDAGPVDSGAFFAVVVKPIIDGIREALGQQREDSRAKVARRRARLEQLSSAVVALSSPRTKEEAWARLPILAAAIGDTELIERVGVLLSASSSTYQNEVGNVSHTVGRLLKDA